MPNTSSRHSMRPKFRPPSSLICQSLVMVACGVLHFFWSLWCPWWLVTKQKLIPLFYHLTFIPEDRKTYHLISVKNKMCNNHCTLHTIWNYKKNIVFFAFRLWRHSHYHQVLCHLIRYILKDDPCSKLKIPNMQNMLMKAIHIWGQVITKLDDGHHYISDCYMSKRPQFLPCS